MTHYTLEFTDRRGQVHRFEARDVGIVDALAWQRATVGDEVLEQTVALLEAHILGDGWKELTMRDAIALASRLVTGEADAGK